MTRSSKPAPKGIRLQKILSHAGVSSRRVAEELIRQGRVVVNGHVADELGTRADPDRDDIRVDGRRLKLQGERKYYLMYKPRGVVSTRSDPQNRLTIIEILSKAGIRGYFYPVGRLDYDSEGLIILTNDGAFAERMAHPRHELERTYEALAEGVPDERDLERLRKGVPIDGQRTLPAQVRVRRSHKTRKGEQTVLEIVIREGRNRQTRKMCDVIAHPVARLRRVKFGAITDSKLRPGQFRDLTPDELRRLGADKNPGSPRS